MVFQIAMLALLLISLINYKGAAGINRIRQARAVGALRMAEIPIGRGQQAEHRMVKKLKGLETA